MTFKHIAEYAALRGIFLIINLLPYRAALVAVWPLAWFFHHIVRFRTTEARRRIREVFPDISKNEVQRIAWVSFRNMVFNGVEMMRARRLTPDWLARHVTMNDSYELSSYYLHEQKMPVIFAVLHMGNWDLAGQAIEQAGVPSFFIMRSQRNPLTTRLINAGRTAHGSEVLDRDDPNIVRKSVRMLKEGKTMAILLDLRARTEALPLEFLGKPANIAGGVALMARLSGAVILPVRVVRKGWFHHEFQVLDAVMLDRKADKETEIKRVTQTALSALSQQVMNDPDQYFWFNKRWVLQPLEK